MNEEERTIPITIRINGGNLALHGSKQMDETRIVDSLGKRGEDGAYHVGGHAVLRLPERTALRVEGTINEGAISNVREVALESVAGNLAVSRVASLSVAGPLHGNTVLRHVAAPLALNDVHGNVAARGLHSLSAEKIHGNLAVSDLSDSLDIESVTGNVAIDKVGDHVRIGNIDGRLALNGPLASNGHYEFTVRGKSRFRVSGNAIFVIRTPSEVRFGEDIEGEQQEDGSWELYLGSRDTVAARVEIVSSNAVEINLPFGHQWSAFDLGPEFEEGMAEMRRAVEEVKATVRNNFAVEEGSLERMFFGQSEEWNRIGETIGDNVQSLVSEFIEALRPQPTRRRQAEAPKAAPAPSGDELRMILEMVERGEITADEAEQLIAAMS